MLRLPRYANIEEIVDFDERVDKKQTQLQQRREWSTRALERNERWISSILAPIPARIARPIAAKAFRWFFADYRQSLVVCARSAERDLQTLNEGVETLRTQERRLAYNQSLRQIIRERKIGGAIVAASGIIGAGLTSGVCLALHLEPALVFTFGLCASLAPLDAAMGCGKRDPLAFIGRETKTACRNFSARIGGLYKCERNAVIRLSRITMPIYARRCEEI